MKKPSEKRRALCPQTKTGSGAAKTKSKANAKNDNKLHADQLTMKIAGKKIKMECQKSVHENLRMQIPKATKKKWHNATHIDRKAGETRKNKKRENDEMNLLGLRFGGWRHIFGSEKAFFGDVTTDEWQTLVPSNLSFSRLCRGKYVNFFVAFLIGVGVGRDWHSDMMCE